MAERIVPIQFQKQMLKEIEGYVEGGLYASKAEFVREAVRKNIIELRKQLFFKKMGELKSIAKSKGVKLRTPLLTKKQKEDTFKELEKKVNKS